MYKGNYGVEFSDDRKTLIKCPTKVSINGEFKSLDGVEIIGAFAFKDCYNIKSINIPKSVKTIEKHAFCSCKNLSSITLPNSVTEIGYEVFWGCDSLNSVTIPGSIKILKGGSYARVFDPGNRSLKSITLNEGVVKIEKTAFWSIKNLKTLYLPRSVQIIEEGAITSCQNLLEIIIPKGQKQKFMQFKALEEYKFVIKEQVVTSQIPPLSTPVTPVTAPPQRHT